MDQTEETVDIDLTDAQILVSKAICEVVGDMANRGISAREKMVEYCASTLCEGAESISKYGIEEEAVGGTLVAMASVCMLGLALMEFRLIETQVDN